MQIDRNLIAELQAALPDRTKEQLSQATQRIVEVKRAGGKVAVVTGSGPNLHEGVTTLIAELMRVRMYATASFSYSVVR